MTLAQHSVLDHEIAVQQEGTSTPMSNTSNWFPGTESPKSWLFVLDFAGYLHHFAVESLHFAVDLPDFGAVLRDFGVDLYLANGRREVLRGARGRW
eukprot:3935787-Rhodomonas_salina.4